MQVATVHNNLVAAVGYSDMEDLNTPGAHIFYQWRQGTLQTETA